MFNDLADTRISLERLRRFCEVAEAGTVAQASSRNNRNQSSYSRDIAALEEFFGADLFRTVGRSRSGRGLQDLTPRGERLRRIAIDCFEALEKLIEFQAVPATLRIGAGETTLQWIIPRYLGEIQSMAPDSQVRLLGLSGREIVSAVSAGELDIGIVESGALTATDSEITSIELGELSYCLFLTEELLERARSQSESDLLAVLPLAGMTDIPLAVRPHHQEEQDRGFGLHFAVLVTSFPQMAAVIAAGSGAGVLPTIAEKEMERFGFAKVTHRRLNALSVSISLIWNTSFADMNPFLSQAASRMASILSAPFVAEG